MTNHQEIRTKLRRKRKERRQVADPALGAALEADIEALEDQLRDISAGTSLGNYNLIATGLEEFKGVMSEHRKKDSKRPQSDLQFVLWKSIESRAGGKLDLKQSGLDQTNQAGLTSVKNCHKVFDALLGMYPSGHDIHEWLAGETKKWARLGEALYDVGCFVKSQRKRSPHVFDEKLLRLWCRWEDSFPGKKFNKFHGLFCTMRRYVHTYHMAGRVSEEGGEAFNGIQKDTKFILSRMPCDTKRIEKITERSQANLKGDVMKSRLQIDLANVGKKRGPYKPRVMAGENRTVLRIGETVEEVDGEEYAVLQSGGLLLKKWVDIFEWFRGGRAPQNWLKRLDATAPGGFTDIARVNEEHTRVL